MDRVQRDELSLAPLNWARRRRRCTTHWLEGATGVAPAQEQQGQGMAARKGQRKVVFLCPFSPSVLAILSAAT